MRKCCFYIFPLMLLFLSVSTVFSINKKVLAGGAVGRGPVLSANPLGIGSYGYIFEIEADFRMPTSIELSLAPRIGFASDYGFNNLFLVGLSGRFGFADGVRPHGLWVGPAFDLFLGSSSFSSASGFRTNDNALIHIALSVEFGWRYTFKFGLSLHLLARFGYTAKHLNDSYYSYNSSSGAFEPEVQHNFYGHFAVGVGYAF